MNQLTIRGLDADLEQRLRETARRDGVSLNQAALRLMRLGAGLGPPGASLGAVGSSLDDFFGGWTADEAREFTSWVEIFERIDPEMWR